MDLRLLKDFLVSYSIPTVIIAAAVATLIIVLNLIFKDKIPTTLKNCLPFVLSIVSYVVYDMISSDALIFNEDALYAGILSGSLASIICSAVKKIANGEPIGLNTTALLIEGLIKGYVTEEKLSLTALTLDNVIAQNNGDEQGLIEGIIDVLKNNSSDGLSDEELFKLSVLIIQTVNSLKN